VVGGFSGSEMRLGDWPWSVRDLLELDIRVGLDGRRLVESCPLGVGWWTGKLPEVDSLRL
jgi:hypothetical protein